MTTRQLLNRLPSLSWRDFLFIDHASGDVSEDSSFVAVSEDELDSNEDPPQLKSWRSGTFTYWMDVATAQDILENVRAQLGQCGLSEFLAAANFYVQNDAFIEF